MDASAYREIPMGAAYPKDEQYVITIIGFANKTGLNILYYALPGHLL